MCELCQYQYIRHKKFVVRTIFVAQFLQMKMFHFRLVIGECPASVVKIKCYTLCSWCPSWSWSFVPWLPSSHSNRQILFRRWVESNFGCGLSWWILFSRLALIQSYPPVNCWLYLVEFSSSSHSLLQCMLKWKLSLPYIR